MDGTEPTTSNPQDPSAAQEGGSSETDGLCGFIEFLKEVEKLPPSAVDERKPEDRTRRYERNLKKFLEDGREFLEARSRGERRASERLIRSDGEVVKKLDYRGSVSKISSILSEVKLERSSAPPTLENAFGESSDFGKTEAMGAASYQSATGRISPGSSETPVSFRTREIWHASMTPVTDFKLPIATTSSATTPVEPSSLIHSSPGSSKILPGQSTPVLSRPTVFNLKPRKAFYLFSPHGSGILRQCQSLPNINKRQRREEKHYQRRSLILEERSRIVRTLFNDDPGQSTPETRMSRVPKSHLPGSHFAKDASERAPLATTKSKICRKLTFVHPQDITKVQSTVDVKAPMEENPEEGSPGKRKEISPQSDGCPPTSSKKVRITPEPQTRKCSGQTLNIREEESNVSGIVIDVPRGRKASTVDRKDEDFYTSKEK